MADDHEREGRRWALRMTVAAQVRAVIDLAEDAEIQDRELVGWLHDLLDRLDPLPKPEDGA